MQEIAELRDSGRGRIREGRIAGKRIYVRRDGN